MRLCCGGETEKGDAEVDVRESLSASLFEVEGGPADFLVFVLLNKSSMDLCLIFLTWWPLPPLPP